MLVFACLVEKFMQIIYSYVVLAHLMVYFTTNLTSLKLIKTLPLPTEVADFGCQSLKCAF